MFRIKTDIRQYKCETKDKVEKLIRNWVIRPSDLIYNADHKEWHPIGEHPAFVSLFGVLEQTEKNTPDTVVTARNPYTSRPKDPAEDVEDEEAETTEHARSEGDVEPQVPPLEERETEEGDAIDAEAHETEEQDEEPGDEETGEEEADDEEAADEEEEEEAEDGEEAEDEEEEADEADEDEEEVTQLVERPEFEESDPVDEEVETTEDARETDVFDQEEIAESISDAPEPPEAPEGVEPPSNDEVTMMTEKTLEMLKITDEDEAAEKEEETTDVREREDDEDREPSIIVADDAEDADEDEPEEEPDESAEPAEKAPKLGRHDLPEELFATNEISSPQAREQLQKLDELGELSDPEEEPEDATSHDTPVARPPDGLRLQEDSGVDEAWQAIADDVPMSEAEDSELPDNLLRETDEIERALSEEEDEFGDEWDEETSEPVVAPADFVSDGYKIPLPFPVRPTSTDVRLGLRSTGVSKSRRDKTFPLPQPKSPHEVQSRRFDLSPRPPRDRTIVLMFGILVVIGLITMIASTC